MDTTRAIAIYGAVLSTVALGWNVGRDVLNARRRIRLLLTDDSTVYIGEKVSHIMMQLRITNVSATRDIEIVAVDFQGGPLGWYGAETPGGVRPANYDDPLPRLLSPAESMSLPIFIPAKTLKRFARSRGFSWKTQQAESTRSASTSCMR